MHFLFFCFFSSSAEQVEDRGLKERERKKESLLCGITDYRPTDKTDQNRSGGSEEWVSTTTHTLKTPPWNRTRLEAPKHSTPDREIDTFSPWSPSPPPLSLLSISPLVCRKAVTLSANLEKQQGLWRDPSRPWARPARRRTVNMNRNDHKKAKPLHLSLHHLLGKKQKCIFTIKKSVLFCGP